MIGYAYKLPKERGGKYIHWRLPEGGPIRLPGENNWEGRDTRGHTPYRGPERGWTGIAGRDARLRIPSLCRTITVRINDTHEGYIDVSSIPHNAGKGA